MLWKYLSISSIDPEDWLQHVEKKKTHKEGYVSSYDF